MIPEFYCDNCGSLVPSDQGILTWLDYKDERQFIKSKGFKIVCGRTRNPNCAYNKQFEHISSLSVVHEMPLQAFMGEDGLARLLSLVPFMDSPLGDGLELCQRMFVPNFEGARKFLDEALEQGIIGQELAPGFFTQEQLLKVIEQAKKA
jgi:hypothetical protein